MSDKTYNGWKNNETRNVALWIGNEPGWASAAMSEGNYARFTVYMAFNGVTKTPDGVSFIHPDLDIGALDELIKEMS